MKMKKNPDKPAATADQVAKWILQELEKQNGVLYQDNAAAQITDLFDEDFVYENNTGNACIHKSVLGAFRELTQKTKIADPQLLA